MKSVPYSDLSPPRTSTVFAYQLKCKGPLKQQRRKSDGVSVFVTAAWCVHSFPASGSILMPTHHHLPEIRTSWVCRVEQEEIKTGGKREGWKATVESKKVWIGRGSRRKRDLPLSLFCALLNLLTLLRFLTSLTLSQQGKSLYKPVHPALLHMLTQSYSRCSCTWA